MLAKTFCRETHRWQCSMWSLFKQISTSPDTQAPASHSIKQPPAWSAWVNQSHMELSSISCASLTFPCLSIIVCSSHAQIVQKILKSNKQFCSKLGKYRMPFAWSVRSVTLSSGYPHGEFVKTNSCSSCLSLLVDRSLFKDNHGALDRESRFSPLFKQESNKISTDDLIKLVSEYRR